MRVSLFILGILLTAANSRAAEWLMLESPHFDMLSNASEKSARNLLVELEQFRTAFLQFTGIQPEISQRTKVVLFATEEQFEPYRPLYQGKAKNAAGFFSGNEISGFMALALGRDVSLAKIVIYHEYVHSLYHEIEWVPPLWFNEGSAEVFSTFDLKKSVAYLGRAPVWHAALLRQQTLMPLSHLFSITTNSPDYNEKTPQGLFYAESWALAHFLICNQDAAWRNKLNAFLADMGSGIVPDVKLFEAKMEVTSGEMLRQLDSYVYGGGYLIFKENIDVSGMAGKIKSRLATAVEQECLLSLVLVGAQDSPAAAYRLIKLQEQYPAVALPHEARAMLALRQGDAQRVMEELWQAVDLHTTNVRTYWYLARQMVKDWLSADITANKRIGGDTAEKLRKLLRHTVSACPDAVEAWEALARTEAFAPTPDRATVEELEREAARWPQDQRAMQILMLTGFARKRLGDIAAARTIAQTVALSPFAAKSTQTLNKSLLGEYLLPGKQIP